MLSLYNSLTNQKEIFKSIKPKEVRLYVCGMTVYDFCHLGHARVMVVFDVINRWLRLSGYNVQYVRNITDIDDKIIAKASEENITIEELTERFIIEMNKDADALGVLRPDFEPKATNHIGDIINMIQILIEKGFAYVGDNNDVYYSVSNFKDYGKLSGKTLKDLRAGNRVDIDQYKKNNFDFVMWKGAKKDEPSWDSPWGAGRPGWHIECSAMSNVILGKYFDIHGGGQDLQFPHHENEIAQSEAANDCKMANYWLHNGFVKIDDEKMSKSLDNFFTIQSILKNYLPEVVRFFILKAHYRSPLNYSDIQLDDAKQGLTRLYLSIRNKIKSQKSEIDWTSDYAISFKAALDDDFNTPAAIAVLYELANEINKNKDNLKIELLVNLANSLGILTMNPEDFLQGVMISTIGDDGLMIDDLIKERNLAKKNKDYEEADRIRKLLLENDILLEDTAEGTIWRQK
ncbi:cysteine--tRNA ligase [Methylophilaceae bacterium]|nr:cysteine--tRNA ligase [Methylophilaceae bacterium]|tara:strand:- start:8227 stop:9603 length:1377 start_codon:yes stop_codon:yes gene_type:complete